MRTKVGTVVSTKMSKTLVVKVDRYVEHPKYKKRYRVSEKFYAHNEDDKVQLGDTVEIVETRPLSKLKRWKVAAVKTK